MWAKVFLMYCGDAVEGGEDVLLKWCLAAALGTMDMHRELDGCRDFWVLKREVKMAPVLVSWLLRALRF